MKYSAFLFILLSSFSSLSTENIYQQAVDNPNRNAKEMAVDVKRKPAQVLEFFNIKPGMHVLDVFAGAGYYTEILSYLVGDQGSVTLYNNKAWQNYVSKQVNLRLKDNRLPNVDFLVTEPEDLIKHDKNYDAAIFILGMHDLYYSDPQNGWVSIDRRQFLKGIYQRLRSGAVFGVIDANAQVGADNEKIGKQLHRVDPNTLIEEITSAGFVLKEQSDILRNENDDKTTSVFLPHNKYNTDRSVLKFVKP